MPPSSLPRFFLQAPHSYIPWGEGNRGLQFVAIPFLVGVPASPLILSRSLQRGMEGEIGREWHIAVPGEGVADGWLLEREREDKTLLVSLECVSSEKNGETWRGAVVEAATELSSKAR